MEFGNKSVGRMFYQAAFLINIFFSFVVLFFASYTVMVGSFGHSRAADDDKQQEQKTRRSNLESHSAADETEITGNRAASKGSSCCVSERPLRRSAHTLTRTSAQFCLLPITFYFFFVLLKAAICKKLSLISRPLTKLSVWGFAA